MTLDIKSELVAEKCEVCGKPVYAGQGFNSQTLTHWDCRKKVPLTKQNRAEHEQKLSFLWGTLSLHCDGYDVSLQVHQVKMKLVVETFVDGVFKGEWMMPEEGKEFPQCQFLNKKTIRAYSPKQKAGLIKRFGKRRAYQMFDLDRVKFYYSGTWTSGKTAISHLMKVCKSVEVYES